MSCDADCASRSLGGVRVMMQDQRSCRAQRQQHAQTRDPFRDGPHQDHPNRICLIYIVAGPEINVSTFSVVTSFVTITFSNTVPNKQR
jgi:hypothetical protein